MDNPIDRAANVNANATQTRVDGEDETVNGPALIVGVAVLFAAFLATLCLHVVARWFFLRRTRRIRRRARRAPLVFSSERSQQSSSHLPYPAPPDRGLDPAVLESLHVFSYSAAAEANDEEEEEEAPPECAVCLCEFEDGDRARILSPCGHRFHADCIDMWFFSHSTCPLCRAVVECPPPAAVAAEPCCELCRWVEGRPAPEEWELSVSTSSSVPADSGATTVTPEAGWKSLDGGYLPTIRSVLGWESWDLGFYCVGGSANVVDLESGAAAGRAGQQAPRAWW